MFNFIFSLTSDIQTRLKHAVFRLARRFAFVQQQIAKARDDTLRNVYATMAKSVEGHQFAQALPEQGLSKVKLHAFFNRHCEEKNVFFSGRIDYTIKKLSKF